MGYPPGVAFATTRTTTYTPVPVASHGVVVTPWARPVYAYPVAYSPLQPFVVPVNLSPHLVAKMMAASAAFRSFDRNRNGLLSKKEWKHAMKRLGYHFHRGTAKALFRAVDTNHSGHISEREFCEWWIQNNPY